MTTQKHCNSYFCEMNLIEELKWRGMIHDTTPGVEEHLQSGRRSGYIGFDPTADSLHIGNLVPIMLLMHMQRAGHQPIALVGGATGMVGDPSGKSEERNLLSEEVLRKNQEGVRKQLEKFLDFDHKDNPARIVNNYDWFKNMSFLDFIRDIGKHITVPYMLAKDSVKTRLDSGLSFTEFTYQLVQGYDYVHLNKEYHCTLQMGGSDQWGNITTGTELIRRMGGTEAFAATCPLIKKADGSKFGKTAGGNVWLDRNRTSPYKFYQFWLNATDEDAASYIRIFTFLTQEEIEKIEAEHAAAPHTRALQKALAEDITVRVHSREDYDNAVWSSEILFDKKATKESLAKLDDDVIESSYEGCPVANISKSKFENGIALADLISEEADFLPSKGEVRRAVKEGSLQINREKADDADQLITTDDLLRGKYIMVKRGKKGDYLVIAE
ncbi:MAG: tyrosine--tRNA ligase [Chitinophagales bacterium]